MRDIPAEIIQEFLSREYRPFWLIDFTVNEVPFRFTNCDVPIAAGGNLYIPRGFKIPTLRYSEKQMVDTVTIQADNLDKFFTSAFIGGAPQGTPVYVRQVYLDENYLPLGEASPPVVWLRLSDNWAEIAGDSSGNREHFAITGTAAWTTTGPFGLQGALALDGATHYLEAQGNDLGNFTTEDYTVCIFIKPDATQAGANARLISKDYLDGGWEVFAQDDQVTLRHYESSTSYVKRTSGTVVDDGSWHSIVIVRRGSDAELFIDDVRIPWNVNDDVLPDPDSTTAFPLTIGKRASAASNYWKGEVAEFMLFDRAIRRSEVAAYHAGTLEGPRTGPVGYWKIDEGFGIDIIDHSGNGKDGEINATYSWLDDGERKVLEIDPSSQINMGLHTEHDLTADVTLSVWVYLDLGALPGSGNLILFDNELNLSYGRMWRIAGSDGRVLFRTSNTGSHQDVKNSVGPPPLQEWVHLAVRHRGGVCQHFLNGALDGTTSLLDAPGPTSQQVRIGAGGATDWNSQIANFQMYERALTDDEIAGIYNDEFYGIAGPGFLTYFEGALDAWTLNDKMLKIGAKSEMARWTQKPLSLHSISCRWKEFKGTECGYAGGQTWCDRTYTRCEDLLNTPNFGGFRWLPSIMDVEIWWGKIPK